MDLKTYCVYCNGKSDFTVTIKDTSERKIVGAMYCCENCRDLILQTSTVDVRRKNERIKTHLGIPPSVPSAN